MNRMRIRFQYNRQVSASPQLIRVPFSPRIGGRGAKGREAFFRVAAAALFAAVLLAGAVGAQAQVPLFDGLDWVMDRGANAFAPVAGTPAPGPSGIPLRQGANAFNVRANDGSGNPDSASLFNNDPWHAVRRNVWPRTADLTIVNTVQLQTEIIDNPNVNDPNNDSDTLGKQVRVQPRQLGVATPINSAHAYLINAGWTAAPNVAVGAPGDYRSPSGGFSFSSDPTQVYTQDYAFADGVHDDFVVNRPGGNTGPATQGELAGLPYVAPEVYDAVETVLKNTNTAKAVWQLGNYNNTPARFTIDIYSPGDGTMLPGPNFPLAFMNVTRAIVRVSYGHVPTAADPNDVQTVDANGNAIKAGVEDSRYSRLYLVDLGQAGWINIAPGGRPPAAFDYSGDPRYQPVVTLYTVTPDNPNDPSIFTNTPAKVTADAVRFNPQPTMAASTPGLTQTLTGQAVGPGNPAIFTVASTGRILAAVAGTNKFTNPPFTNPPFDITANDAQPLIYVAREEAVANTTPIVPFDPTKNVSGTNPLTVDPTLTVTAPVFYCIDNKNSNATKSDGMGGFLPTVTVDRIRWRYAGLPDAASGSGTISASPLLANVRCRDGVLRPILYFATTDTTGTIGHIYALDPLGNRQDAGPLNRNTTTAYWVYPSYRPLTAAELGLSQYPAQYHDPNYNNSHPYVTGVAAFDGLETRSAAGALTAAPPWGPDISTAPTSAYVDGDIIGNPSGVGHFIVRDDTQVPFTAVQSSPMVIDDPDNTTGAQILIAGGMNGRVYCFDAGGRGDFIYDKTTQNDAINPATGLPFSVPGTTERYWTWPHLRGDAFHAKFGSGVLNTAKNSIFDEVDKVAFPSSPAFESINVVAQNPFFIGAADGHMYALFAKHDVFNGIDNKNLPRYAERRSWVYPNLPANLGGSNTDNTQSLGAALSTPAIFTPTGQGNPFLYFTCAGRVYCINAHPPLGPTPTMIPNTAARWVYPFTSNPPFPGPNDSLSAATATGFNGTAPLLVSQADLNSAQPNPNPLPVDMCYTVGADGTVYGIDAFSNGAGNLLASGESFTAGNVRSSPTASRITGILGLATDTINEVPTVVFSDDDGAIWGVSARPDPGPQLGIVPNTSLLPVIWGHFDSSNSRVAAAALTNGMIYEGGEDGQLRGYGVGTGADGLGTTLDAGEPAETSFGISPSGISIDLRGLNVYSAADYDLMTRNPAQKTPARNSTGGAFTNSATPLAGINVGTGGPNTDWPVALDWGDGLYIAAYGVYHAQPQNNTDGTHAPGDVRGVPKIQVEMTISQPGQPSINVMLDAVPRFASAVGGPTNGNLWPDDTGITNGEHDGITIYGVDDPSQQRNANSNLDGEKPGQASWPKIGRDAGVFPFAVYYKLPILPDATKPFTPGNSGYRITARAVLTQQIYLKTDETNPPLNTFSESSNFLQFGQHDYAGLVPQAGDGSMASPANPVLPKNPNQVATLGRRRDVLITNPLAVTVRSYADTGNAIVQRPLGSVSQPTAAGDNTNGNKPNIIGFGPSVNVPGGLGNVYEVLSNGNRTLNPYATTNSNTSPIKALLAPVGSVPHGSSQNYGVVNDAGQKIVGFYVADRSNLAYNGPGGSGRHLRIRIIAKPERWLGGNTSVMNPLPWDLMPNDQQDTRDYPNLPLSALSVAAAASGQDAINGTVQLTQPVYAQNGLNPPDPNTRVIVPTELAATLRVPKFQPANVNRGVRQWKRADGTAFQFGSPYTDIGGNILGNGPGSQEILGPLTATNGTPVAVNSGIAFPAGGYVGELIIEAVPNGAGTGVARFNPQAIFNDSRGDGTSQINQAYRALEVGSTVPPSVKMRVVEQTIDLGKLPHGTGYSDVTNTNPPDFRVPFSPGVSLDWPGRSPWDDDSVLGKYFRPFTLVNESNVNLYDVRIGNMMADVHPNSNTFSGLTPLALTSDQTNASLFATPYLGPAVRQARGIGIVSSFDHDSTANQSLFAIYPERRLWPIPNPYVDAAGIQEAAPSGLQTVDALPFGVRGWFDGVQPQPTVHKPRVGDTNGTIASVPDVPYDAQPIQGFATHAPEIALAIPVGTPVGTYSAPVYPFEDNVPPQWQEWLVASNGFNPDGQGGFFDSHDGVINSALNAATGARTPVEPYSDPTFVLKTTVREARLTGGVTRGTLSEIDTFTQGPLSTNPFDNLNNTNPDILSKPYGLAMLPAAVFQPTGNGLAQINLYFSTPRQPIGSPFETANGPRQGYPVADAPWSLAYSALFEGRGGWAFGNPGTTTNANATWWSVGGGNTYGLFPGYGGGGQPNNLADLFPSTPAEGATLNVPYVPGTRVPRTVKHASPTAAIRTFTGAPGVYPQSAQTAWLIWQASIDKVRPTGAGSSNSQFTESRTFYAPVPPGNNGAPSFAGLQSLLNDPALPKLSPKPLLLSVGGSQDVMFLFWHAGSGAQSQLYFNANSANNFPSAGWSRDKRLESPDALSWQSDPSPMYHQAWDTVNNQAIDVIDVVYTGVLKNRRTVETMMSRYQILPPTPQDPFYSLSIIPMPQVIQETLSRQGNGNTYAARDAAWAYGTGPNGTLLPTDVQARMQVGVYSNDNTSPFYGPTYGAAVGINAISTGLGKYDPASGLLYFTMTIGGKPIGGQMIVDMRSGTVSFPQIAPKRTDIVFANYSPMVMRLNTSRDESNIVRTAGFGNFSGNDPAFVPRPATTSPGSNQNPIAILEREPNPDRVLLSSPQVVFPKNSTASFPRLWVLYRKSDVSGPVKATLYYKAMRLMARLPRPVALNLNNGVYDLNNNITVAGNAGPYEVDWIRGRVYFTELDEGRTVTISFKHANGNSGNLTYRVAWGDEISSTSTPIDPNQPFVDNTTAEVVLPTDSAVNEGQVTAFQIPASLRTGPAQGGAITQPQQGSELWVFWTSTRAGSTDLFYETIRPNLYPSAANQR